MDKLDTSHTRTTLAVLLVAAGVLLLASQFYGGIGALLWPFFIIVPGVALIVLAARAGWPESLAVAGAIVTGVGVILLAQDLTHYYRSWAYAWTLLPLFAGAALFYCAEAHESDAGRARAVSLMQWSAGAFVVLGALFELLLFSGGQPWARYGVPLALIAVGVVLLLRRTPPHARSPKPDAETDAGEEPGE